MRKLIPLFILLASPLFGDYVIIYDQPEQKSVIIPDDELNQTLVSLESDITVSNVRVGILKETYNYIRNATSDVIELGEFKWVLRYEEIGLDGQTWESRAIVYDTLDTDTRKQWDIDATAIDLSNEQRLLDEGCLHWVESVRIEKGTEILFIIQSN